MRDAPARLLAFSYAFPPFNDTSGIVAAKRLREAGVPFDVILKDLRGMREIDGSLTTLVDGLVRRHAMVDGTPAFAAWSSIRHFIEAGVQTALHWESIQGPYEHMYSRAHLAAGHFAAAWLKAARPQLRWRAEFSDPLSHDVFGQPRTTVALPNDHLIRGLAEAMRERGFTPPAVLGVMEWAEALPFAMADEIVFTNPNQRDFMVRACGDPALAERILAHCVVSPHPTLPRQYYELHPSSYPLDPQRRHIAYFGHLYENRGLSLVLDAIAGLDSADRDRLAFHVFTTQPASLAEDLKRPELADVLHVGPYVDYLEFLALTDAMDVLLVNDAETPPGGRNPFLPSKWSDYKGSHAAVWGIIEDGSILAEQPLDHRSPLNSLSAAQQVLTSIARSNPHPPRSTIPN